MNLIRSIFIFSSCLNYSIFINYRFIIVGSTIAQGYLTKLPPGLAEAHPDFAPTTTLNMQILNSGTEDILLEIGIDSTYISCGCSVSSSGSNLLVYDGITPYIKKYKLNESIIRNYSMVRSKEI